MYYLTFLWSGILEQLNRMILLRVPHEAVVGRLKGLQSF